MDKPLFVIHISDDEEDFKVPDGFTYVDLDSISREFVTYCMCQGNYYTTYKEYLKDTHYVHVIAAICCKTAIRVCKENLKLGNNVFLHATDNSILKHLDDMDELEVTCESISKSGVETRPDKN